MTQGSSDANSLERALRVLRDQIGHRFSVSEGAGRAEMARVLQAALSYDKHQANTIIDSLIHIDRLHYHPAGEQPSEAGGRAPALFGMAGVSGELSGPGMPFSVGYWQIGPEYD